MPHKAALVGLAALGSVGSESVEIVETLHNWDNMQYTMPIKIGTPPQMQLSLPDSGSVELVVLGGHVQGHARYDVDKSNSGSIPHPGRAREITYGSGTAYGVDGTDKISMGGAAARVDMLIEKGGIIAALPNGLYYGAAYDGIMGLGVTDGASKAVLGSFGYKSFTFDLSSERLKFGGRFEQHSYDYSSVSGNGYWATHMGKTCVTGHSEHCQDQEGVVLLDSGTSLVYLPQSIVTHLQTAILGNANKNEVSCQQASSLPDVEFTIGATRYTMKPQDYLMQAYNKGDAELARPVRSVASNASAATWLSAPPVAMSHGMCGLVFQAGSIMTQSGPMSILGMSFMRRHAVHFERKQGNLHARIGISDYISHGSKAHRRQSAKQANSQGSKHKRDKHGHGDSGGALEAMGGEFREDVPLMGDFSKAIPPFRSARHAPKPFAESKLRTQAPPAEVVAAREAHFQRTGERFEWWVDLDQL